MKKGQELEYFSQQVKNLHLYLFSRILAFFSQDQQFWVYRIVFHFLDRSILIHSV